MRAILVILAAGLAGPVQADPVEDFVYAYGVFGGGNPAAVVEGLDGDWLELSSYADVSSRRDDPEWLRVFAQTHMESFCDLEPPSRGILRLETSGTDGFTFVRPGYEGAEAQHYRWVDGVNFARDATPGEDGAMASEAGSVARVYRVSNDIVVIDDPDLFNTASSLHILGRCPDGPAGGTAASSLDAWVGEWMTGREEEIVISLSGTDGLEIEGYATYGANDAARIEIGAVNTGMFSGSVPDGWIEGGSRLRFSVDGETIAAYDPAMGDVCTLEMELEGDVLRVTDNYRCGGANVSFTGDYTKAP